MAVADANYYFTAIDVGSYGRDGDSYVLKKSNFWKRFNARQLDLPGAKSQPSNDSREGTPVPHILLGDETFWLLKKFAATISFQKSISYKEDTQLRARQSQTRCRVYLWNFEQQMACSTSNHSCASKLCVHHNKVLLCFAQFCYEEG
jgi:hypothetical protein